MLRPADLDTHDRRLCQLYAATALVGGAIMGTMAVLFVVRNADAGPVGVVENFLRDATTNLASQFVYADLVLVWAALGAYMIIEGRRHGIRHVWAYIVGAPALALVVSFGVFMYVRQLRIAAARPTAEPIPTPTPTTGTHA